MAGIFHPSRGGVRGGQDQFKWDDVKTDKDRENYLGHSVMAPVGKWQEGKDLIWYTRDKQSKAEAEERRKKELNDVKSMEARAMAAALGHQSFTTGTTSLTAKELQEVLSRGQTEHRDEDVVKGMGYTKTSTEKQNKYGTEFVGGSQSRETNQGGPVESNDRKHESSKKMKKEKRKKKKKRKKRTNESEDISDEEFETYTKPRSSKYQTHSTKDDRTRFKNEEIRKRRKKKYDSDDSLSSRKSESSYDEKSKKRYKSNEKYKDRKRRYGHSDDESPHRKKLSHSNEKRKVNKTDSSKSKRKLDKSVRHGSEDESEDNSDTRHKKTSRSKHNSRKKSQPDDSHIKFVSRSKRPRHDSSSDSSS